MDQAIHTADGKRAPKRRRMTSPATITSSSFHALPHEYPFAVSFGGRWTDCGTTIQLFRSRSQAERFARAIMRSVPMRNDGQGFPCVWALVHARPNRLHAANESLNGSICYMAVDPGGVLQKMYPVPIGYGGVKS